MLELSTNVGQTLLPGQSLTFNKVDLHTGCGECFKEDVPTSVKLCKMGVYSLEFSGNVTANAATTPVALAMTVAGTEIPQTRMNATPAAVGDLVNVGTGRLFKNCCCDMDRISITNVGTNPIVVASGANLRVVRKS